MGGRGTENSDAIIKNVSLNIVFITKLNNCVSTATYIKDVCGTANRRVEAVRSGPNEKQMLVCVCVCV